MPPIGLLLGKVDFSNLFVDLSGGGYATLAEANEAGAPTLRYGLFVNNVIDFLIVAFALFLSCVGSTLSELPPKLQRKKRRWPGGSYYKALSVLLV